MTDDRIPCPGCGAKTTLEEQYRKLVEMFRRVDTTHDRVAHFDLNYGVMVSAPEHNLDHTGFSSVHNHSIPSHNHSFTLRETNISSRLELAETCTECGLMYRPELRRLKLKLAGAVESFNQKYPLDALTTALDG